MEAARADLVDTATARSEAGKAANEEFESGFFQGYANLKMRVFVDHPKWDLAAYSGVNSDFWEVESSTAKETPTDRATGETRPASEETDIMKIDPSA